MLGGTIAVSASEWLALASCIATVLGLGQHMLSILLEKGYKGRDEEAKFPSFSFFLREYNNLEVAGASANTFVR